MVVGAGPAGLEAARVCSARGNKVIVFEASKKLKEAVAITEMGFQAFVNSEPYKDEENIKKLIQDFDFIENY